MSNFYDSNIIFQAVESPTVKPHVLVKHNVANLGEEISKEVGTSRAMCQNIRLQE